MNRIHWNIHRSVSMIHRVMIYLTGLDPANDKIYVSVKILQSVIGPNWQPPSHSRRPDCHYCQQVKDQSCRQKQSGWAAAAAAAGNWKCIFVQEFTFKLVRSGNTGNAGNDWRATNSALEPGQGRAHWWSGVVEVEMSKWYKWYYFLNFPPTDGRWDRADSDMIASCT